MIDTYTNFAELNSHTGIDGLYSIDYIDRGTDYIFVTPHGGEIEIGTAEITKALAKDIFSYYIFSGADTKQHITSNHFDEPVCLSLIAKTKTVISIHGEHGEDEFIMPGGLDMDLINKVTESLTKNGFTVLPPLKNVQGDSLDNICNKGINKK